MSQNMANSIITSSILLISFLTLASLATEGHAYHRTVSKEQLGIKDDQQTQLTFYYHDTLSGSNPTSVQIAKASGSTSNSPTTFGALSMVDNPLTKTADSSSKLVGRAQGMSAMADQNQFSNIMIMSILLLDGEFNGSTLSVLGRSTGDNPSEFELPVVGGTGGFRFAKGYIQAKTQTYDKKTSDTVVECNVFLSHSTTSGTGSTGSDSPTDDGGSTSGAPSKNGPSPFNKTSHASLSNLVSLGFLLIPLLYLCIV